MTSAWLQTTQVTRRVPGRWSLLMGVLSVARFDAEAGGLTFKQCMMTSDNQWLMSGSCKGKLLTG